jgi:hypothetical protein
MNRPDTELKPTELPGKPKGGPSVRRNRSVGLLLRNYFFRRAF